MKKDFADLLSKKFNNQKIVGITRRWLINIIGIIVILFVIAFIVCTFVIKS